MSDLTFQVSSKGKFNVRSAAIIRCGEHYLISKREDKDYYSIPGGRVAFNEDSKNAILRELKEELNWDIASSDVRLVRIIENFFSYMDGTIFHEYLFVYFVDVDTKYFAGDFINLENPKMHMLWFKKDDYLKLDIKPSIFKEVLIDPNFKHLIIKEN